MEENKRNVKAEAELRASLYEMVLEALAAHGYTSTPVKGGALVTVAPNVHCKLSVSVCAEDKVAGYLDAYAEQQAKNAERAAERAAKAEEKAAKAAERAAKKAAKEAEQA